MNQTRRRRTVIPLLSCLTVLVMFLGFNALYGIFPCGGNTVTWCDMDQQAVPLLLQFRRQILSGEGLGYSVLDAGGMQFYGIFFFFLSNPLSLLVLVTDLPTDRLVVLLVIVKLALSAGTAAFWLQYRIRRLPCPMQLLLAVMYGCSGYGLFYYQNLMWLDIMLMTPLLLCAVRYLLQTGKALPYAAVLSAMMILSFYLSYMVVLFTVIYTALSVQHLLPKEQRGKAAARFWGSSILSACVTAFVWIPCILQIAESGRSSKLLSDLMRPVLFQHLPDRVCVLGATCIGFAMLPMLFLPRKPCSKVRQRDRMLFLLMAAAVVLDPVNQMWHGGSYQAFPMRWGMFPILLMLTFTGEQLSDDSCIPDGERRTRLPFLPFIGIALAAAAAVIIRVKAGEILHSYLDSLWISPEHALCMLVWFFLMTLLYSCGIVSYQQRTFSLRGCTGFLAVLFLLDFALNFDTFVGRAANDGQLFAQTTAAAELFTPEEPTARLKTSRKYVHANMIGADGYPTTAHYTSLTRADYLRGMKRLGYSSYWLEVPSTGGTLLSDALWNIRYQLGTEYDFPPWTEVIGRAGLFAAGKSSMTLPSALLTDAEPETIAELPEGSRFSVQQYLAEQYLDAADAVIPYSPDALSKVSISSSEKETVCTLLDPEAEGEISYSLFLREPQALYFDLYSDNGTELYDPNSDACDIILNGVSVQKDHPENNRHGLVYLGTCEGLTLVSIILHKSVTCESFGLFGMQTERLAGAMQHAAGTTLQYQKGVYTAECETDRPQTLILSAAYSEGLTAEVNGEVVPVFRVNTCQAAVRVPAGKSRVTVRFHVRGLNAGILTGLAGLLAFLLYLLIRRRIPAPLSRAAYAAGERLLRMSFCAVLLMIYLMPTAACIIGKLLV
ncbi:MAG: YfhO family protein [Oscillospiraceae bacterium]|nr:YfhO family protein [Oscillospiraceae bacterium]